MQKKEHGLVFQQKQALDKGTSVSMISGLAVRYHDALKSRADRFAPNGLDHRTGPAKHLLEIIEGDFYRAFGAETPIAFALLEKDDASSVRILKVNPNSGKAVYLSEIELGVIARDTGEKLPVGDFTSEDLALALEQLEHQRQSGLIIDIPNFKS